MTWHKFDTTYNWGYKMTVPGDVDIAIEQDPHTCGYKISVINLVPWREFVFYWSEEQIREHLKKIKEILNDSE